MYKLHLYSFIFLFITSTLLDAQVGKYKFHFISNEKDFTLNNKFFKTFYKDSSEATKDIIDFKNDLISRSYILTSIDSIRINNADITAYFYIGNKYKWKNLRINYPNETNLKKIQSDFKNHSVQLENINKSITRLLRFYENNGYPFAEIQLDEIEIVNDSISASLRINKNKLTKIDSIYIKGNARISSYYLYKHIGFESGDIYNEKNIYAIKSRLDELLFLKQIRDYEIGFKNEYANIYLYLDNKKANQFNGIVGVVPNDKTTGKLLLTGELRLLLINSFKNGEIISFNWKKLESTSQNLDIKFTYPFLFKKPIGIDASFNLLKKDTIYLNVNSNLGLLFLISGTNYIKAYVENKNSTLLSTYGLEYLTSLPNYADINTTLYGLGVFLEKLDYKYNPRKGTSVKLNIAAGNKDIKMNSKINEETYKDINLNTFQSEGLIDAAIYFQIYENNVLKLRNNSGIMNSTTLFENELFKLGGLNTIRGFDEESIFASTFSISSIEYRYILEKNSSIYAFFDGAFYEKNLLKYENDTPFGFGFGIDFDTKAGIFTINYALGKQFDNPIELRSAKIHFGFVNRF